MNNMNLPEGLVMRPATSADNGFIERLYRATRDDLQLIDAEPEFIDGLIDQQFNAQVSGYGDAFPNAMYFIVEKHGQSIGRTVLDFGSVEIRVVDIAFIPEARGKGFGEGVLRALQQAAQKTFMPLSLSVHICNLTARKLYARLGFQVAQVSLPYEHLVWYPGGGSTITAQIREKARVN